MFFLRIRLSAFLGLFTYILFTVEATEVTVDASGEFSNDSVDECIPKFMLNGKLSTCKTYQIATMNASPQRCLHIEMPEKKSENAPMICADIPEWFDGTNGCDAYARKGNEDWCELYGNHKYDHPLKATEACCACGGGVSKPARFQVGDYVNINTAGFEGCNGHIKIAKVNPANGIGYLAEIDKMCGPKTRYVIQTARGIERALKYRKGQQFAIKSDTPGEVDAYIKVELKKCRKNSREQEFQISQATNGSDDIFSIRHLLTSFELSSSLGMKNSQMKISQIFEDDLFDESGDFFFISSNSEERNYLISGQFGQTEFSGAKLSSIDEEQLIRETPFSMWQFKETEVTSNNDTCTETNDVDEHVKWIEGMTRRMGIDYLEELAPWHLLDVEREASKVQVKARFRELSRSFHPDKVHPSKRELYEKIFVLLQNAYEGLKSKDEIQKEKFRHSADTDSQLFAHSQNVVELLPFHWTKLDSQDDDDYEDKRQDRYVLNASSYLEFNKNFTSSEEVWNLEQPAEQLWVLFLYSATCGMSRSVVGFVDLAAKHLKKYEDIKVGAYACGQYKDHEKGKDPIGVTTDPICKQFQRRETPNVHVIVETLNPDGEPDGEKSTRVLKENSKFKYFYSSVPYGNSTEFYPHNLIDFAQSGKRVWYDSRLVHKMVKEDFASEAFLSNYSIVAYTDGIGNIDVDSEITNTIETSIPSIARRFGKAGLYVGTASCGYGEDDIESLFVEEDDEGETVDCSKLDVGWLPDIKLYGPGDSKGVSLLRGKFGDRRDVQIGKIYLIKSVFMFKFFLITVISDST